MGSHPPEPGGLRGDKVDYLETLGRSNWARARVVGKAKVYLAGIYSPQLGWDAEVCDRPVAPLGAP